MSAENQGHPADEALHDEAHNDEAPRDEAPAAPARRARVQRAQGGGRWARWAFLAGILVAIAAIASTVRGSAFVYLKWVDEIMAPGQPQHWVGRVVRVGGLVVPGSIQNRPGAQEYRFRISRNGAVMPVEYQGIVPDTFTDCTGVTVRGALGADGMFTADEVVAKCPSRYEAATVVNGQCVMGLSPERGAGAVGPAIPGAMPTR